MTGGAPPAYQVTNPNVILDAFDNFVVSYQINNGNHLISYLQNLDTTGNFLWSNTGKEIGSYLHSFSTNKLQFIEMGVVYRNGIFIQKIDWEGNFLWPTSALPASSNPRKIDPYDDSRWNPPFKQVDNFFIQSSKVISDNSGGFIIASAGIWDGYVNNNFYLQRVDGEGDLLWTNDKLSPQVKQFNIAIDRLNDIFVIWSDNDSKILIQKIDGNNGQTCWPDVGVRVFPQITNEMQIPNIVGDGEGGCIVASGMFIERISSKAESLWTQLIPNGNISQILSDQRGGAAVFYARTTKDGFLYAEGIGQDGKKIWGAIQIKIYQPSQYSNVICIYATRENNGDINIVYGNDEGKGLVLYVQKLDAKGNKPWGENGISVSSVKPYWPQEPYIYISSRISPPASLVPDNSGGIIVAWAAGENIFAKTSSYI